MNLMQCGYQLSTGAICQHKIRITSDKCAAGHPVIARGQSGGTIFADGLGNGGERSRIWRPAHRPVSAQTLAELAVELDMYIGDILAE